MLVSCLWVVDGSPKINRLTMRLGLMHAAMAIFNAFTGRSQQFRTQLAALADTTWIRQSTHARSRSNRSPRCHQAKTLD